MPVPSLGPPSTEGRLGHQSKFKIPQDKGFVKLAIPIRVQDFRLSIIWTETILNLVGSQQPSGPLGFLGRDLIYEQKFNQMMATGDAGGLTPPWPGPYGKHFWSYYLNEKDLNAINGEAAWRSLVPFRRVPSAVVAADWFTGRLRLESFFYPHGLGFVATALCRVEADLADVVELAFKISRKGRFTVSWNSQQLTTASMMTIGEDGIAQARGALGSEVAAGVRSIDPFTVMTVIRASGAADKPLKQGGAVQRALDGVTAWRPSWQKAKLPALDLNARLQISHNSPDSHVLYARPRGRAVWFPSLFTGDSEGFPTLGCYHRNLVFTSLQVESLSGFLAETAKHLPEWLDLSSYHRECARRAAGIVGRLYGGDKTTYRSWSARAHIEQNDLVGPVNAVRLQNNMSPLG